METNRTNITRLNSKPGISTEAKFAGIFKQFEQLLQELRKMRLSPNVITLINNSVEEINSSTLAGRRLTRLIKQKQSAILKLTEKEHKIVPKNYYRTLWMVFGMSGIGLPIGVVFGLSIGNIGLLGLGLPIGMVIGLLIGTSLDKKAFSEGRQLAIEIKN